MLIGNDARYRRNICLCKIFHGPWINGKDNQRRETYLHETSA